MKRRLFLSTSGALAVFAAVPARAIESARVVQLFKSATCGCCGNWANHMRSAGFTVQVTDVADTTAARKRLGMPDRFGSCHTATVDGYAIEGHVPATEVKRLLAMKTKAIGLAVPGMPPSAPGMDVRARSDPYQVFLIDVSGQSSVFADYPK
jgi:Predicted metal-binding protein